MSNMKFPSPPIELIASSWVNTEVNIVEDCQPCAAPSERPAQCKNNKKRKTAMYFDDMDADTIAPLDLRQKQYLSNRLFTLLDQKNGELRRTYGLDGDEYPRTFNELVKRITEGRFSFPEDKKDKKFYYTTDVIHYIKWRDPSVKEDEAGYEVAYKKVSDARQLVEDAINLKSTDEAYAALKDFEAMTFSA